MSVTSFTDYFIYYSCFGYRFLYKGFLNSRYSFVFFLSSKLNMLLGNEKKQINAGPKIFAAQVGFVFFLLLFLSFVLQFSIMYYTTLIVFLICAILEFAVGFCVACKLYPFIRKFY
ncbi:MAG: DUF4395 family protein [Bacteroidales bacterium]|nr:DUF4395 family protein [Bacteroidales bacterium]